MVVALRQQLLLDLAHSRVYCDGSHSLGVASRPCSTSNLIVDRNMGLTLSTASFCFVAATGAEIKSGALNTEDRERLLSGLSRLLRHVQSQRPEAVDKVRELDSNIRHKAPHPSRIEQASKYKSIIEFANDDQTFQLDGTQLSSKLDQMLEASRNLS